MYRNIAEFCLLTGFLQNIASHAKKKKKQEKRQSGETQQSLKSDLAVREMLELYR